MKEEESEQFRAHPPAKGESKGCRDKVLAFIVLGVLLGCITLAAIPVLLECGHGTGKAFANAKMIGYALFNFENDYGHYPNDDTAKEVLKGDGVEFLSSAGGSNFYFSQLIAGGYANQEGQFYVVCAGVVPDEDISSAEEMLKSGEVGFAYVMWESSSAIPEHGPLVIAYLEAGKKRLKPKRLFGQGTDRMVVLRKDMSVTDFSARRDGTVMHEGKDFFDWSQPHWGGQKPKIVWPE